MYSDVTWEQILQRALEMATAGDAFVELRDEVAVCIVPCKYCKVTLWDFYVPLAFLAREGSISREAAWQEGISSVQGFMHSKDTCVACEDAVKSLSGHWTRKGSR